MSPYDIVGWTLIAITAPAALWILGCIAVWKLRARQARRHHARRDAVKAHPATTAREEGLIEAHRRDREAYIMGAVEAMATETEYAHLEAFANGEVSR